MPIRIFIRKCPRPGVRVPWEYVGYVTEDHRLVGMVSGVAPTQPAALFRAEGEVMDVLTADDDRLERAALRAVGLAGY